MSNQTRFDLPPRYEYPQVEIAGAMTHLPEADFVA